MRRAHNVLAVLGVTLALAACTPGTGPGMSARGQPGEEAGCQPMAHAPRPGLAFGAARSGGLAAGSAKAAAGGSDCKPASGERIGGGGPATPPLIIATAPATAAPPAIPSSSMQMPVTAATAPAARRRKFGIVALPLVQRPGYTPELSPPRGIVVTKVEPDGAAALAGVQPGDVMLTLGPVTLMQIGDLQAALAATQPGSAVTARLWRNGSEIAVTLRF